MQKRKAFTLIEVLFSVFLIATIGMALLQSVSNNTKLMRYTSDKKVFMQRFSMLVNHMGKDKHNKTTDLYELIREKYDLDDDTRAALKKDKYTLLYEEVDSVVLEDSEAGTQQFSFSIAKESMHTENRAAYIYRVSVIE